MHTQFDEAVKTIRDVDAITRQVRAATSVFHALDSDPAIKSVIACLNFQEQATDVLFPYKRMEKYHEEKEHVRQEEMNKICKKAADNLRSIMRKPSP